MNPLIVRTLKPRNPFARAARCRSAGSHQRTRGGQRQHVANELRRELRDMDRQRHSP